MMCPTCSAWSAVLNTRLARRRRECANGHRFSTVEVPATQVELMAHQRKLANARRILRKKGYLR